MNVARSLDLIRPHLGPLENHLIDGLTAGRISRREFIRHGSLLGLSLRLLGQVGVLAGCTQQAGPAPISTAAGATIRVACGAPGGAIDPVTVSDIAGLVMLQQTGEFLCLDGDDLTLRPMLAESWSSNAAATIWTFKLRHGVKFHDGREMTADDVVASIDRLADPANASNARSVFAGVLDKGGTRKVDERTVEFHLLAANGNFPYLVSSDNVNAIIVPADMDEKFESTFVGTGPFKLERYSRDSGASFVRNEGYWGERPLPARVEFTFYVDIQPQILALQGGEVDVINQLPLIAAVGLLDDPNYVILRRRSASHHELHMRTDMTPFKDARVRRAIALAIDRRKLVEGLMRGRAQYGNDSPFAPVYPSTDTSIGQRTQDLREAKQLLEAAGLGGGFKVPLFAQNYQEIPEYAVLVQNALKQIGVEIDLRVMDTAAYYGQVVYGASTWLDSIMGITEFGHRGVPNIYLSTLRSDGAWNSAHFRNRRYDLLAANYVAALDLESQRRAAGQIEQLLLEETPSIRCYFYDYLTATANNVVGVHPTAMSQIFLARASKTFGAAGGA